MREVFLAEPMASGRLFAALTGGEAPGEAVPATLAGHAIAAAHDGIRLAPARRAEARAAGAIVTLDRPARARLDFFMAAIGAAPLVAGVEAGGRRRIVDTFILPGGLAERDWSPEAWAGEWHDMVCEAAEEIGALMGRREASEMPRLLTGIGYRALGRARGRLTRMPRVLRSGFGHDDVEILSREPAYANYFAVDEFRLRFRRFDGALSEPVERAVFGSGDAVMVLPYDPKRDLVLLIEQFRCGPLARREPDPWCLEAVAGRCDPMEEPEATVRREAREEAGLTLGRIERICSWYSSVGMLSEYITAFVGEADLSRAEPGAFGVAGEHEDIRTFVVPLDEALAAVARGEVNNAPPILALLWLEKQAPRLRRDWGGA
ncbi:NUDIX domain-containing protein [Amaricoccus solimangrovi]|uniref:ADP-ribose pyrophosphatase n=1 Tax=Amaricoccus solimangrovi TaxID=2589815 RepID=A0A501WNZ9_9RHOB|nr:NUDIX domain-containing protein [Amaricoccus solimangrovi]TPE51463.1 NUDIX domain-containing protein [Amaricoccus solimangrovi]